VSTAVKAVPALIVASLGALLAWLWLIALTPWYVPLVIAGLIAIVGGVLRLIGRSRMRSSPIAGAWLTEAWAVTLLAFGSVIAGGLIVLAVWTANQTPTGTPESTKQVLAAIVASVTAFLTASVIKGFEDLGALMADSGKADFGNAFASCTYDVESPPWKALNATYAPGAVGWGFEARRTRSSLLAANPCP